MLVLRLHRKGAAICDIIHLQKTVAVLFLFRFCKIVF